MVLSLKIKLFNSRKTVGCVLLFDSQEKCESVEQPCWADVRMWQTLKHCDFLQHCKYDECQTLLHGIGSTH